LGHRRTSATAIHCLNLVFGLSLTVYYSRGSEDWAQDDYGGGATSASFSSLTTVASTTSHSMSVISISALSGPSSVPGTIAKYGQVSLFPGFGSAAMILIKIILYCAEKKLTLHRESTA
jgi:hypothetical protein